MMNKNSYILGIDTSNYTTSVAITDKNNSIVSDCRRILSVKQGERGLRQSDALFQHTENLPVLIKKATSGLDGNKISAIAVSTTPRRVEGSYMPVFNGGKSLAYSLSSVMSIPLFEFSHQDGHVEAALHGSKLQSVPAFLFFHLSGGTFEILKIKNTLPHRTIEIVGGSKDISAGQLLDRVGVALGMKFPAGASMDKLALSADNTTSLLKKIYVNNTWTNLSGTETQALKALEAIDHKKDNINHQNNVIHSQFARELFDKISLMLLELAISTASTTGINNIVMAGGVASSMYIRNHLKNCISKEDISIEFGIPSLCSDNAVGIAMLGGQAYGA